MASTINAKNTSTGVVITPDSSGQLELQTADTTRMTIDVNGNVGVGTSSPTNNLEVTTTSEQANISVKGGTGRGNIKVSTNAADGDDVISGAYVFEGGASASVAENRIAGIFGVTDGATANDRGGRLSFYTKVNGGNLSERMRITSAGLLQFNSGYGSVATAFGCRAWVNFNGQGTVAIRASGNVSSITDNGIGNYTVNFTTAMPDGSYSVSGTGSHVNGSISSVYLGSMVAGSAQVVCQQSGGFVDPVVLCITIMR